VDDTTPLEVSGIFHARPPLHAQAYTTDPFHHLADPLRATSWTNTSVDPGTLQHAGFSRTTASSVGGFVEGRRLFADSARPQTKMPIHSCADHPRPRVGSQIESPRVFVKLTQYSRLGNG
jgi:hypothetical protein